MTKFKKLLFPIDFSDVSPKIAPWALTVAQKFSAEIHLLFVARRLEHLASLNVAQVSIEDFENEVIRGAETKMEEFANKNFQAYSDCKTRVVLGDAAEEILNYVESEKIDLIVIGTHGRKGMERILFGSVAERVIKMAPVPVMSINPYRTRES
ncbi:MAG: universal stress protein [Deltaproteobacteria bacterium]|nr:universal stress protein [Deltaproteobacteria bacterium]